MRDEKLSQKKKGAVKEAENSPQPIKTKKSSDAAIELKDPSGSSVIISGAPKEIKTMQAKMEDAGKNPEVTNGTADAKVDATGKIQSAEVTVFNGSYRFSPQGAPGGNTPQRFENEVIAHEYAHVGGQKVRSESEVKELFGE